MAANTPAVRAAPTPARQAPLWMIHEHEASKLYNPVLLGKLISSQTFLPTGKPNPLSKKEDLPAEAATHRRQRGPGGGSRQALATSQRAGHSGWAQQHPLGQHPLWDWLRTVRASVL